MADYRNRFLQAGEFHSGKTIFDIDPSYNEGFTFPSQLIKHPVKVADQFPHQGIYGKAYDTSNRGFITEDGVFANSIISGEIFASPINRYESSSTKLFKPYPLGFCNPYGRMSAVVFYDMDAECFVYLKNMYTKVCAKMTETREHSLGNRTSVPLYTVKMVR